VIERVFDAPRPLVYRAFVDPEQLVKWFGPVGWSVPRETVEVEPRVGGSYRMTMVNEADASQRAPVNARFAGLGEEEVIGGVEENWPGIPGFQGPTRMTLRIELFDAAGGKTRLVLRQGPYSEAMEGNARVGWESSFTRLDAVLAAA